MLRKVKETSPVRMGPKGQIQDKEEIKNDSNIGDPIQIIRKRHL